MDTPRRYFIATGTAEYPAPEGCLPHVPDHVQSVKKTLEELGYVDALPNLPLNPTRDQLVEGTRTWFTAQSLNPVDQVVIYYTGHGEARNLHRLILKTGMFSTLELFDAATESGCGAKILFLFDTCYSGQAAVDIWRNITAESLKLLATSGTRVTLVSSSRSYQEAEETAFTPALIAALRNENLQWGYLNQPTIPTSAILQGLKLPPYQHTEAVPFPATSDGIVDFSFPNRLYIQGIPPTLDVASAREELERRKIERHAHWIPKSSYFSGRKKVLQQINAWLDAPSSEGRALIITGGPGAGKSAILSQVVNRGHNPPVGIHARERTAEEFAQILARATGVSLPSGTLPHAAGSVIAEELRRSGHPTAIVVDALDEARQRFEIAQMLSALTGIDLVWLLVGTRRDTHAGSQGRRVRSLGPETEELDLDSPDYQDDADISEYVRNRLLAVDEPARQSPYRNRPSLADTAASTVARQVNGNFLIARMKCDRLLRDRRLPDVARPWEENSSGDLSAEYDAYLRRYDDVDPRTGRRLAALRKRQVVDLLQPLAFAKGQGLPWDDVWAPVASAIAGEEYSDSDVRDVLQEAASYITVSLEEGRSVYRLFHESFAEYLRDRSQPEQQHRRIARVLRALTALNSKGEPDWLKAHPYSRRYLSVHAAEGGCLDDFVTDPLFLAVADPAGLRLGIARCSSYEARQWAGVYMLASHELDRSVGERASYLGLAAHQLGLPVLAGQFAVIGSGWNARATKWRKPTPHFQLPGHENCVTSVAVGTRAGRSVIISGSKDQTVRVWDLETLEPVGPPLEGHQHWVTSVAVGTRSGRSVIVSGSEDRTVRVWDLDTLEPVGAPLQGHKVGVTSVAVGTRSGRYVIVSGSEDQTVRVWDLTTFEPVGAPLQGHQDWVTGVAVGTRCGRYVIVSGSRYLSGSEDRAVWVWDLETLEPVGAGHQGRMYSVAVGTRAGRSVIVSGGHDQTVRVWDLETLEPVGAPLPGHQGRVFSVAVGTWAGRAVIVSGGDDQTVRVWDLETLQAVGAPLQGHQSWVTCVAVGTRAGRSVIVSGSEDQTVRVWDLESPEPVGAPLQGHQGRVYSVAVGTRAGRSVIVSGSEDQTVRVSDLETLEPVSARHQSWVTSVAVGTRTGRFVIVAGSWDQTVRVWDLETLEPVGAPMQGHQARVYSVAVCTRTGRSVIVSGSRDHTLRVWDLETLQPVGAPLQGHQGYVESVAVGTRADRSVIVSGSIDRTVRIWDLETLEPVGTPLEGHQDSVFSVALGTRAGRSVIVSGSFDQTLRVWDLDTLEPVGPPLRGHQNGVSSVAVGTPAGRSMIVSGSFDSTVRVWDLETLREVLCVSLGSTCYIAVVHNDEIVAACKDGIVRLQLLEGVGG